MTYRNLSRASWAAARYDSPDMVISLAGEWDAYRREELKNRLEPAYREHRVVLDLTAAKHVTGTLICALIAARNERELQGLPRASVAVKSAFVRRLLSATGVESLFSIHHSVEDAIALEELQTQDAAG